MTRRRPLHQAGHVVHEVWLFLVSLFSRTINAVFFGGSMYQTLSARAYIEGRTSEKWARRARRIDRLFFWAPRHCERAWASEVERAWKTIRRNNDESIEPSVVRAASKVQAIND